MTDDAPLSPFLLDDTQYQTRYTQKFLMRKRYVAKDPAKLTAFIPGIIRALYVSPGQKVRWGERLLVLEAMKMKNDVTAPMDAVIKAIHVQTGQMVTKEQLLIEFDYE
jgi:biotin carboxyl carrier protein